MCTLVGASKRCRMADDCLNLTCHHSDIYTAVARRQRDPSGPRSLQSPRGLIQPSESLRSLCKLLQKCILSMAGQPAVLHSGCSCSAITTLACQSHLCVWLHDELYVLHLCIHQECACHCHAWISAAGVQLDMCDLIAQKLLSSFPGLQTVQGYDGSPNVASMPSKCCDPSGG